MMQRLEKEDYRLLVRFLAAQTVRTPAFLIENLPHWRKIATEQVKNLSQTVAERLERTGGVDENSENEAVPNSTNVFIHCAA